MVDFDGDDGGGGDMDPSAAADYATGMQADAPDVSASDGFGGGGSPISRLFDGNAEGPSVPQLEADYGLGKSVATTMRGIMRVATGSGVPPIAEIVLGAFLFVRSQADTPGNGGDDREEGVRTALGPGGGE